MQRAAADARGLLGTQCLWTSDEVYSCTLCLSHTPIRFSSVACELCFKERHIYAHYLRTDVPGPRPACEGIAPPGEPEAEAVVMEREEGRRVAVLEDVER